MTSYERMIEEERALSRELRDQLTAQQAQLKAAEEALESTRHTLARIMARVALVSPIYEMTRETEAKVESTLAAIQETP